MRKKRRKKKGIGFISKTALALNVLFALLLLLSYLASFVNPSSFWPAAFIGLAYPFLLLINTLFLIYWLFRKPVLMLVPALPILIGWKFLFSTVGFRESTAIEVPKSSEDIIRIMTWNVHGFKPFNPGNDRAVKDQMLDIIRKEQPDILCIQEYYSKRRGENNIKKALIEILNSKHYYIHEDFGNQWEVQGMVFFSKLPITDSGAIAFPNTIRGNEAIFADFVFNKKKFRVYNIHLQSIRFQPEDYEYIKNVKEINTNVESSKRIGGRLKRAFIKRSEQALLIRDHITKTCKSPYIIAGDFNDTPTSYAVNTLSKGMYNSFRKKGSGFGITYNGDFPNFQIDYILASKDFTIKSYLAVQKKLSDHYPVISDLEFN